MINLSEIVNDPDLADTFAMVRPALSTFDVDGNPVTVAPAAPVNLIGVVTPSKSTDTINFLPEGERNKQAISIYCSTELKMGDGRTQASDLIQWRGSWYRVAFSKAWQSFGYYFVMATNYSEQPTETEG